MTDEAAAEAPETGNGTGQEQPATSGEGPAVTLSASPEVVQEGSNTTLSWSASNADSCTASGGWSGTQSLSGSQTIGPLSAGTTFSLNCGGTGGSTLEMISVKVIGPVALSWVPPSQNVDGSDLTDLAGYRIYYGEGSRSYSDTVEVANPATTSHSLSLASGDYYVAMTALDADGNESGFSNEVIKTRP